MMKWILAAAISCALIVSILVFWPGLLPHDGPVVARAPSESRAIPQSSESQADTSASPSVGTPTRSPEDDRSQSRRSAKAFRIEPRQGLADLPQIEAAVAAAEQGDAAAMTQLAKLASACAVQIPLVASGEIDHDNAGSVADTLSACEAMPDRFRDNPLELLERAAESGSIEAKIAYPALASAAATSERLLSDPQLAERLRRNAERYLREAALAGSVDALNEIAHQYNSGVLLAADPVAAVAYMRAADRTGLLGASAAPIISAWERQLTPEQMQRSGEMADQIYVRCCL